MNAALPATLHTDAPPVPRRPYLVFVRAGAKTLHRQLIAEDPARNWDCCVSWYAEQPPETLAEYYRDDGDNKFEGFLEFWRHDPCSRGYRYYLLLDDDVRFRPGDISRFLELCDRHGTQLSQPALTWTTLYNLNVTLANPLCELRQVNFVEVMAPCFSAATLERLLDTFALTRSTWGIDWAWACLLRDQHAIHVVDAVRIEHTKVADKRNGVFYRKLQGMGIDAAGELERVKRDYGDIGRLRTLPSGHVFRDGVPAPLGALLLPLVERAKFIARQRKKHVRRRLGVTT